MTKNPRQGLSFIELLVTLSILSIGIVGIYKAYFLTLNTLTHITCRLQAVSLLHNRIASIEESYKLDRKIPLSAIKEKSQAVIHNKTIEFNYQVDFSNLKDLDNILQLDLRLSWKEGPKTIQVTRSVYIAG